MMQYIQENQIKENFWHLGRKVNKQITSKTYIFQENLTVSELNRAAKPEKI